MSCAPCSTMNRIQGGPDAQSRDTSLVPSPPRHRRPGRPEASRALKRIMSVAAQARSESPIRWRNSRRSTRLFHLGWQIQKHCGRELLFNDRWGLGRRVLTPRAPHWDRTDFCCRFTAASLRRTLTKAQNTAQNTHRSKNFGSGMMPREWSTICFQKFSQVHCWRTLAIHA
jgi:hypothetical protein